MKGKRISKKQVLFGTVSSLMVLLSVLTLEVAKERTPIKIDSVIDGDTLLLEGGKTIRLLGVNTAEKSSEDSDLAKQYLEGALKGKKAWLEYDRYQKDRYGRDLAWLWVGCESTPKFMASNFMIKTRNSHNEGLVENPIGCKNGILINEQIVKMGWSKVYFLSKKGEMKYEGRLYTLEK